MLRWLLATVLLLPALAAAQPTPSLDVQRWHLVGGYRNFVLVHDGNVLPAKKFGVDATMTYALRPLQRTNPQLGRVEGIIEHLHALHARGAFAPADWVEIDVMLGLAQFAHAQDAIAELGGQTQVFSLGDLWVEGRFRPLHEETAFVTVGIIPFVTFPIGNRNLFLTAGLPTFGAKAAVSKRMKRVHFAGHIGYRLLPESALVGANVAADDEILYAIGAGVTPLLDRLDINFELHGVGVVGPGRGRIAREIAKSNVHSPLEWLIDARVALPKNFDLLVGAGSGITAGIGSPSLRVMAGFSWAPPGDTDGDGLVDTKDQCKLDPEDLDGFEDADGCPDDDNDGDGILDSVDACPLDVEDVDGFQDEDGCPELDNDFDGVLDGADACPLEPEDRDGYEDEDGCIDPDDDGDGIPDVDDRCVLRPEDEDGWQDEDGCPDEDNDGDGIRDERDLCPDEPEVLNGIKDEDGCPDETLAVVSKGKIVIFEKVYFANNRDTILRRSFPLLQAIKQTLEANPRIKLIRIEGHTDDKGRDSYNQELSERRAASVMRYLVEQGIDASRLTAVGYGEARPIADNGTEEGKEANRRVEFTILEQE